MAVYVARRDTDGKKYYERVDTRPQNKGSAYGGGPTYIEGTRTYAAGGSGTSSDPYTKPRLSSSRTSQAEPVPLTQNVGLPPESLPVAAAVEPDALTSPTEQSSAQSPVSAAVVAQDVPQAFTTSPALYAAAQRSGAIDTEGRPTPEFRALRERYSGVRITSNEPAETPNLLLFQRRQVEGVLSGRTPLNQFSLSERGGPIDITRLRRVPIEERNTKTSLFVYEPTGERFTRGDLYRSERITTRDKVRLTLGLDTGTFEAGERAGDIAYNVASIPEKTFRIVTSPYNVGTGQIATRDVDSEPTVAGQFAQGLVGTTIKYPVGATAGVLLSAGAGAAVGAGASSSTAALSLGTSGTVVSAGAAVTAGQLVTNPEGLGAATPYIAAFAGGFSSGFRLSQQPDTVYTAGPQLTPDAFTTSGTRARVYGPLGDSRVVGNVETGGGQFGGRYGFRTVRVTPDYIKTTMVGTRGDVAKPFLVTTSAKDVGVASTQTGLTPLGTQVYTGASPVTSSRTPAINIVPKTRLTDAGGLRNAQLEAFAIGQARNPRTFDGLTQTSLTGFQPPPAASTPRTPSVLVDRSARVILGGTTEIFSEGIYGGGTSRGPFSPPSRFGPAKPAPDLVSAPAGAGSKPFFIGAIGLTSGTRSIINTGEGLKDSSLLGSSSLPIFEVASRSDTTPATDIATGTDTTPITEVTPITLIGTTPVNTPRLTTTNPPPPPPTIPSRLPADTGGGTPIMPVIPPPPPPPRLPSGSLLGAGRSSPRTTFKPKKAYRASLTGISYKIKTSRKEKLRLTTASTGLELRGL